MLKIKNNLQFKNFPPNKLQAKKLLLGGFTLIELLVVIAIIGILSSVVLASLNSARDKASDIAVKANLVGIRAAAQMHYDDNGNYGIEVAVGACVDTSGTLFTSTIFQQIEGAKTASGATSVNSCASIDGDDGDGNADNWAVAQQIKSDLTKFWCVDSTGVATSTTHTADQAGADAAVTSGFCQ